MGASGERSVANSPGLTERQKKWFASVEASLERDTGKTLQEWVAIARTCPYDRPKARSEWLREHHGLGANRGAHVLSVAFPSAVGWDDAATLRAALKPDAIQISQFNGAVSGQTVYHLHFHIIPRWEGVPLGRHAGGGMADTDELKDLAGQIAAMIS